MYCNCIYLWLIYMYDRSKQGTPVWVDFPPTCTGLSLFVFERQGHPEKKDSCNSFDSEYLHVDFGSYQPIASDNKNKYLSECSQHSFRLSGLQGIWACSQSFVRQQLSLKLYYEMLSKCNHYLWLVVVKCPWPVEFCCFTICWIKAPLKRSLECYSSLQVYTVKCTLTHIVISAELVLQNCAVLSSKFVHVTVSING